MTPALLITTVRQALDMPMLSEGKCLSVARAVLEAVREPSKAAAEAGGESVELSCDLLPYTGNRVAAPAFRAMIDALLSTLKTEAGS